MQGPNEEVPIEYPNEQRPTEVKPTALDGNPSLLHLSRPSSTVPPDPLDTLDTRLTSLVPVNDTVDKPGESSSSASSSSSSEIQLHSPKPHHHPLSKSRRMSSISVADFDQRSCISIPSEGSGTSCTELLSAISGGVVGKAMAKDQWQPDDSSALCSYPLCTAMFAPPENRNFFTIYDRRHHCRLCGRLFCSAHSNQRVPILSYDAQGKRHISTQRVCDVCVNTSDEVIPAHARSRRASIFSHQTDSTRPSDEIITPSPEDPPIFQSSRQMSIEDSHSSFERFTASSKPWSSTTLSTTPSTSQSPDPGPVSPHSSAPLFTPPLAGRKRSDASIVQRRGSKQNNLWTPGYWGYKQEEFDVTYNQDSDGEDEGPQPQGGLVVDGPFRFRTSARRNGSTQLSDPPIERTKSWAGSSRRPAW